MEAYKSKHRAVRFITSHINSVLLTTYTDNIYAEM